MKKKNFYGSAIALSLAVILSISNCGIVNLVNAKVNDFINKDSSKEISVEDYVKTLPTLTVDMSKETGDILHGASGFLYGISNEDVPTTNTLVPLKPKVLATKGALGTEHPYGDALDVAETFLSSGGEQVMMYNSNYYGVFGVTADYKDYSKVLETELAPYIYQWKQDWKAKHGTPNAPKDELGKVDIDKAIIYIPINEGTPVNGASSTNVAWKAYYEAIKKGDPDATIAGPNSCAYNLQFLNTDFRGHIQYCADNDCMPDIITWHELEQDKLYSMSSHMDDFRNIWANIDWTKWLETHEEKCEMPQIVINEYAEMKDCGVPGALVNWIARLEDEKIYGCLPFWQQANNLNGLTSDANEGASAWWVYKWYGDMSGKTLEVNTSTAYNRLYGVASLDNNKQMASVLMGGEDGIQRLVLENIGDTETFKGANKVHIKVQKAEYNGYAGTVNETQVILEGAYEVNGDGMVEILIPKATYADAFYVTITKAEENEKIETPLLQSYSEIYEAEKASKDGLTVKNRSDYMPTYYFSNGKAVLMTKKDEILTYEIEVPVDGNYNLNFLYGNGTGSNRNDMNNHKPKNVSQEFTIDGESFGAVIMENTLFTAITDCYCINVDLNAGKHTITIKNLEASDLIHDALRVTYEGGFGSGNDREGMLFEAEQADFNTLSEINLTAIVTENTMKGYSGNGYVTGLNINKVTEGGGIRFNVVVENSGIYNVSIKYQAKENGKINVYVGNTVTTLDSLCTNVDVLNTDETWKNVAASIYLQKGINIVDIDSNVEVMLDYMQISEVFKEELQNDIVQEFEAENTIPNGSSIKIENSNGASGDSYVIGMEGNKDAKNDINKYLEFEYEAKTEGIYALTLFQSNDDICGSHSYNIKIIDKYASVMIMDENGNVTSEKKYFFINTSSDDTFKEKTVYVKFSKGMNKIRIFNDDSWHVTWGGTQSTPGTNILYNFAPNFDKFIITKAALNETVIISDNETGSENITFGEINLEEYMEKEVFERDEAFVDSKVAYFIDCGDHGTNTLSEDDLFGRFNSVTDKIYGPDFVTGYKWGLVISEEDIENPRDDGGVYSLYQWANEWNVNDDLKKTETFRYAHNQMESGISKRYIKYMFELQPGEYDIEVCMGNVWGNSANPDIYIGEDKINTEKLSIPQNGNKIVNGKLTLTEKTDVLVAAYSDDATINMNYIKINIVSLAEAESDEVIHETSANNEENNSSTESENVVTIIVIVSSIILIFVVVVAFVLVLKKKHTKKN